MGPYETERQALDDVRDIYDAARASRARGTMQVLSAQRLEGACEAARVELGEYDRRVDGEVRATELPGRSRDHPTSCKAVTNA